MDIYGIKSFYKRGRISKDFSSNNLWYQTKTHPFYLRKKKKLAVKQNGFDRCALRNLWKVSERLIIFQSILQILKISFKKDASYKVFE